MREIKFRAWDKETKQMMVVQDLTLDFERVQIWDGINPDNEENVFVRKFDEVVPMQYTGLKDENGKEIYEGDIALARVTIEVPFDSKDFSYFNVEEDGVRTKKCCKPKPCKVVYDGDKGCWKFVHSSGKELPSWITDLKEVEVIGNIYENPELIEN